MSAATKAKLYYTPTSCGAASYIAAFIGKVDLDTEQVDLASHKTATGVDFYTVNPKGNVPALVLPGGVLLNEGSAILQWIADQAPTSGLAPANGTVPRYQLQNALNYVASEVHTSIGGLFNPKLDESHKALIKERAYAKMKYLTEHDLAGGKKFLLGDQFTVADSYLYIVLSWTQWVGLTMNDHPVIKAYYERVGALEGVKKAHELMNAAKAK